MRKVISIAPSLLCTLHCIAMPFVASSLPQLMPSFDLEFLGIIILIFSLFLAWFFGLRINYKVHKNLLPGALWAVFALLPSSLELFHIHHESFDWIILSVSIIGIGVALFIDHKLISRAKCAC